MSDSLWPHELQHTRLPCLSLSLGVCPDYVHSVDDAIQPSHHLSLPSPATLSLSQHQGLFQWVSSLHQVAEVLVPKCWSFSISVSPSNEYPGLISFKIDWFDLLAVHGTLKSFLQHHSWICIVFDIWTVKWGQYSWTRVEKDIRGSLQDYKIVRPEDLDFIGDYMYSGFYSEWND